MGFEVGMLLFGGTVFSRKDLIGFCKSSFYDPGCSFISVGT